MIERFEAKYIPEPNSGCWLWEGATLPYGYGQFAVRKGLMNLAHRVSWLLHRGEIPKGLNVLHKCDVPGCVNPDHLFLGTHADNVADKVSKGRGSHGSRNGMSTLTEADVLAIRADPRTPQWVIAKDYGITQQTVSIIKTRKKWKHLQ